jgi:LysM repeat protein
MEFEDRNPKPEAPNSGLPMAVLLVLVGIICLLLYAGWHLMSDDASKVTDLNQEAVVVEKNQDSIVVDSDTTLNSAIETAEKEEPKLVETSIEEPKEPSKEVVNATNISGDKASHTVKDGETFFGIANKFNVSANTLKKLNPTVDPSGIKVGVTKIIVPIQGYHVVGPGDILKVVAKKYDITVEMLMSANGKTKNFAERGEKLVIPRKVKE